MYRTLAQTRSCLLHYIVNSKLYVSPKLDNRLKKKSAVVDSEQTNELRYIEFLRYNFENNKMLQQSRW